MMTGMERLAAAANGEQADRIPVFCNLFDQGAKLLGMSTERYYSSGECVAKAQLLLREQYGYDNLWSLFYVGREAELLGCRRIIFAADGPPNVGEMVIKKLEDIDKLQVPDDLAAHPAFREVARCLAILRDKAGGRYPICAYLTASMALPAILMGMEGWLRLLLLGPAEARDALLEKCSAFFRKELDAYRAAGADVIIYSNPFGSTDLVTMRLFQELSLPWMRKDLSGIDTAGLVYYCGGARFNQVIGQVIDQLGLSCFYLSPLDDVAEGKAAIAGRGLACGVINDIQLVGWSEARVEAEVERIIAAGKPGGKFLFGTLLMPCGIPERNIVAMLRAAYKFGSQP